MKIQIYNLLKTLLNKTQKDNMETKHKNKQRTKNKQNQQQI